MGLSLGVNIGVNIGKGHGEDFTFKIHAAADFADHVKALGSFFNHLVG